MDLTYWIVLYAESREWDQLIFHSLRFFMDLERLLWDVRVSILSLVSGSFSHPMFSFIKKKGSFHPLSSTCLLPVYILISEWVESQPLHLEVAWLVPQSIVQLMAPRGGKHQNNHNPWGWLPKTPSLYTGQVCTGTRPRIRWVSYQRHPATQAVKIQVWIEHGRKNMNFHYYKKKKH